jgi:D-alanyl-lipoteichoic acid acyltransferase DltB (MBOAT superfamily)
MENFNAPYLSTSVAEFWRKWHISLTSWFKDYLYIPLGGSRKGKARKYINKMIVFLVSGLWHGDSTSYVIWGGLNGLYQIIGEELTPVRNKFVEIFQLHRKSFGHKLFKTLGTFILVDFSWIFFRASTTKEAIQIIKSLFNVKNPWILFDGSIYGCGLDIKNFWIMIYGLCVLFFADYFKHKGIFIRQWIIEQDYWLRWIIIDMAIIILIVFGIWGSTYDVTNFIYFQF